VGNSAKSSFSISLALGHWVSDVTLGETAQRTVKIKERFIKEWLPMVDFLDSPRVSNKRTRGKAPKVYYGIRARTSLIPQTNTALHSAL
jgi:hypothetical protein